MPRHVLSNDLRYRTSHSLVCFASHHQNPPKIFVWLIPLFILAKLQCICSYVVQNLFIIYNSHSYNPIVLSSIYQLHSDFNLVTSTKIYIDVFHIKSFWLDLWPMSLVDIKFYLSSFPLYSLALKTLLAKLLMFQDRILNLRSLVNLNFLCLNPMYPYSFEIMS